MPMRPPEALRCSKDYIDCRVDRLSHIDLVVTKFPCQWLNSCHAVVNFFALRDGRGATGVILILGPILAVLVGAVAAIVTTVRTA